MTRSYFTDFVTTWDELLELCSDEDCSVCEDIISDDGLDEYIDSDICNTNYSWRDIRDFLNAIPTEFDYYLYNGPFDYIGLNDDDFVDYKGRVLDWMDENGLWEDEECEDEEYDDDIDYFDFGDDRFSPDEEDAEPTDSEEYPVEEDFSVGDLMSACGAELVSIRQIAEQRGELENATLLAV